MVNTVSGQVPPLTLDSFRNLDSDRGNVKIGSEGLKVYGDNKAFGKLSAWIKNDPKENTFAREQFRHAVWTAVRNQDLPLAAFQRFDSLVGVSDKPLDARTVQNFFKEVTGSPVQTGDTETVKSARREINSSGHCLREMANSKMSDVGKGFTTSASVFETYERRLVTNLRNAFDLVGKDMGAFEQLLEDECQLMSLKQADAIWTDLYVGAESGKIPDDAKPLLQALALKLADRTSDVR